MLIELGLLMGKLGRHRVRVLTTGETELPSDVIGLQYMFADKAVPSRLIEGVSAWASSVLEAQPGAAERGTQSWIGRSRYAEVRMKLHSPGWHIASYLQ